MRGLIEEMRNALTWFAQDQREHFAMVLSFEDSDAGMVHGAVQGLDQGDPAGLYLTFAHEARTERAYVDVMLELMNTRREAVNAERTARGRPEVPPAGRDCYDPSRTAPDRIRSILRWWRESLHDPQQPIVLSLLPGKLPAPEIYRSVVMGLLPFGALEPWTRYTRLIVRDRREEPFLAPVLRERRSDATVTYTADFSPKACEEGLAADAANTQLAPRDRGMAMLQLAALDFTHQRFLPALEKYGALANLFQDLGEKALIALCLCGAGDVHARLDQLREARKRYAQGAELATAIQAKPVLLNCLIGLGRTTYAMGEYQQAEAAWDAAARVAGSLGNPYGVADAVEQVGASRLGQHRVHDAVLVWERALELIKQYPYGHREVSILQRMVELAAAQRWGDHERSYKERLAVARLNEAAQGGAHG